METLKKLTKEQLLEYIQSGKYENKSYFNLVEDAPTAIFIHEFGRVLYLNKKAIEIIEEEKKQNVLGTSVTNLFVNETHEKTEERLKKILNNKQVEDRYLTIKTKKGTIKKLVLKSTKFIFEERDCVQTFVTDITEQEKNQEEIVNQRENYKNLLKNIPFGVIIHDGKEVLYTNFFAQKLLNETDNKKINYENIFKKILPSGKQTLLNDIVELGKEKETPFHEIKFKTKEGKIIQVEIKSIPTIFEGKKAYQIIISKPNIEKQLERETLRAETAEELNKKLEQEIQQRKETEKKLLNSKIYIENIINSSLDMIIAVDSNNIITEFNKAAQKTFGYKKEEIIGKSTEVLFAQNKQYNTSNMMLIEKGSYYGEIINKRKNGTNFTSLVTTTLLKNEKGEKIGWLGLSRDISEIKKIEEKLYTQSAKLNLIFQNTSHIIFTVNKEYKLTSFNNNFIALQEALTGVSPKINSPLFFPNLNEGENKKIKAHEKALLGFSSVFESQEIKRNGEKIWLETYIDPIFLQNNQVEEATYIVHDITEKKQTEEQIKEALKEKEILLKEVHHRVKNNLQIISSIINLQSNFINDKISQDLLKDIQNRIKTMSFIHESLYQTKDFSNINFTDYLKNLTQNLIHSYKLYDKKIEINLTKEPIFLNLDQSIPCGLIINELITNSFKHAFKDTNKGKIDIEMQQQKENITITIKDNGVGFPKEIDFKNTESLGLQLVTTLTEQISGKIEVETKKGTIFTLSFINNLKNKNNE